MDEQICPRRTGESRTIQTLSLRTGCGLHHLADIFNADDPNTHAITSLLCHLSTSLPPYLVPFQPMARWKLARDLRDMRMA